LRILLVEDNQELATCVGGALKFLGHETTHARTIVAATELILGSQQFDAALLDVDMESGTSAGVARMLSERRIPYVVATAHASGAVPAEMVGHKHLRKPYALEELEKALDLCTSAHSD